MGLSGQSNAPATLPPRGKGVQKNLYYYNIFFMKIGVLFLNRVNKKRLLSLLVHISNYTIC